MQIEYTEFDLQQAHKALGMWVPFQQAVQSKGLLVCLRAQVRIAAERAKRVARYGSSANLHSHNFATRHVRHAAQELCDFKKLSANDKD